MPKGVQQMIKIEVKYVPRLFFDILKRLGGSRNLDFIATEKGIPKILKIIEIEAQRSSNRYLGAGPAECADPV